MKIILILVISFILHGCIIDDDKTDLSNTETTNKETTEDNTKTTNEEAPVKMCSSNSEKGPELTDETLNALVLIIDIGDANTLEYVFDECIVTTSTSVSSTAECVTEIVATSDISVTVKTTGVSYGTCSINLSGVQDVEGNFAVIPTGYQSVINLSE